MDDEKEQLKKDVKILRELLWLSHGHDGLYGDDGEMQCMKCWFEYGFWDWKRTPVEEIQERIFAGNLKKFAVNKTTEPDRPDSVTGDEETFNNGQGW